jgi:hypothetical protein
MSGPERYCNCGADADALTDEAHAEGCPNRPSMRTALGLSPSPPIALGMTTAELIAFIEREGLDVLVHAPRDSLLAAPSDWTVAAWDYSEPRLHGLGTGQSFLVALVGALQSFERSAIIGAHDDTEPHSAQQHGSTHPPPLPIVGGGV